MQLFLRALGFFAIPCLYLAIGWLNPVQAAKSALLGTLAVTAISAWTLRHQDAGRRGRWLVLGAVLLFLLIIAYQAFLRDLFGVSQDDGIVLEAIFNTDRAESGEFILQNLPAFGRALVLLLACFGLYALLLARLGRIRPTDPRRLRLAATICTVLFVALHLNPTMRKEDPLLYFPLRYLKWQDDLRKIRALQDNLTAALASDRQLAAMHYAGNGPRTVVFVLGESDTRLNWSLYGYPRPTNPELTAIEDRLLRFTDVLTTNGSTIRDVRMILTPASRTDPQRYAQAPDLITMARQAGYKTFWITNHATDLSGLLSIIANHADVTVNANRGASRGEGSYDEMVLPHLSKALADPAPLKLIFVHLLGAHPAYYFRYPEGFARFNDAEDAVSRELEGEGRAFWAVKMRNYYDNAILYGDHVLRETIARCEAQPLTPIAWLFAPDHGEDVAHYDNFVGHNTRVAAMYEIPMLFWRSPAFPVPAGDARQLANRPYQTDQLDHTLLGLLQISGDYYDPRRDLLSPRFEPLPRFIAGKSYPLAPVAGGSEPQPELANAF